MTQKQAEQHRIESDLQNTFSYEQSAEIVDIDLEVLQVLAKDLQITNASLAFQELLSIVLLHRSVGAGWPVENVKEVCSQLSLLSEDEIRRVIVMIPGGGVVDCSTAAAKLDYRIVTVRGLKQLIPATFDAKAAATILNFPKKKIRLAIKRLALAEPISVPALLGVTVFLMMLDAGQKSVETKQSSRYLANMSLERLIRRFANDFCEMRVGTTLINLEEIYRRIVSKIESQQGGPSDE